MRIAIASVFVLVCAGLHSACHAQIFREDFDGFFLSEGAVGASAIGVETDCDDPLPNCGIQANTELEVFGWGWVDGWEATGRHAAHAVNLRTFDGGDPNYAIQFFSGVPLDPPGTTMAVDPAVMIWHNNVITLQSGIPGSNASGQNYTFDFVASPAVYQNADQVTTADDGLLIEMLRADNSILASHTHLPGDWAGDLNLVPDSFQYMGDGTGDLRVRIGPSNFGSGHFGGAIDDLKLTGNAEIFSEAFNGFTAPSGNFNGLQFESGLPVAHSGDVPNWDKEGGGTVHMVDRVPEAPPMAADPAVMIWQDNVITLESGIPDSNSSGQTYTLDFLASPAVYQAAGQVTTVDDGILIEVLRADDSVLASHTHMPGEWGGDLDLVPDSFQYEGDGTGDIRLRVGPSNFGSGRFGGAIDDLALTGNDEVFSEGFDGFTAPETNFNGVQFQSGLPVAHSGDVPNWLKSGGGAVHIVDRIAGEQNEVLSDTNTLTLVDGIEANDAGVTYQLSALIGPTVWAGEGQATTAEDFVAIELLRADDTVLASFEARPEPWDRGNPDAQDLDGDGMLDTAVEFEYTGDGSGPVRIRIFGEVQGSRRFGGAIDDLVITREALAGDYNGSGSLDPRDMDILTAAVGSGELTFDANGDGSVTLADRLTWLNDFANTWLGDSNLDGEFNSDDLLVSFAEGKYATEEPATWLQGDWDGDGVFGSDDLLAAFAEGGYLAGPKAAAVPEPANAWLLALGLLYLVRRR